MATKAQECKALEQIKKIVDSLGEDSYIMMAFAGCFELAEENIRNDWGCSMLDKIETAEQACDLRREQAKQLEEKLAAAEKELKLTQFTLEQETERHRRLVKDFDQLRLEKFDAENRAGVSESKIVDLENENVHLKAKLYDLMMK